MTKKQPVRQPADRTIAVAIVNPTVAEARVEVQVDSDPNLWLRGTTNADGYCSWQWSDSLGDSVLEITAAGYLPYQQSVHWTTYTDANVGPPPLNCQMTVGGNLPALEPIPVPVPPQPTPLPPAQESGPLHIDRPAIRDAQNQCWQWRGFTDFLLFYRFLCDVDIAPFLEERIALGANILRCFSMVGWDECDPRFYPALFPNYYAQLRDFAEVLADRGLRLELTVFADAQIVMPNATDRQHHLQSCLQTLQGCWNVVVEVANEPFKNLPGGDDEAIALGQQAQGHGFLIATGEYDSWPPDPVCDYGTTHCDRTEDWPRRAKDLMDRCDNSGKCPWIGDEPVGAAEVLDPWRRDTNPDNFAWYAATCQMFGPGATFHCEDGIHSRTPIGPVQTECAKAFFWALHWMPKDSLLQMYQRGDMGSEAGIGNMPILHDDAIETRSYCKGNGSQEWCCQIQTTRDHATPRDGWRVVSEPRRGFVYLEKP